MSKSLRSSFKNSSKYGLNSDDIASRVSWVSVEAEAVSCSAGFRRRACASSESSNGEKLEN